MRLGKALIGVDEFGGEWKVVVTGFISDFDMHVVFENSAENGIIKFDDKNNRFTISKTSSK